MNTIISPDGRRVAYTVQIADWEANQFQILCFLYSRGGGQPVQLTQTGTVLQARWLDEDTLALLRTDPERGGAPQVWTYDSPSRIGVQITNHATGVQSFEPFADGILFLADDPERQEKKARKEEYGNFIQFEQEESASALYYTNVHRMKQYGEQLALFDKPRDTVEPVVELSESLGRLLKIAKFVPSPLNDAIYINTQSKDDEIYRHETSCFRLRLDPELVLEKHLTSPETKESTAGIEVTQMQLPKGASIVDVSPDGTRLLVQHKKRDAMAYTQTDLWTLDLTQLEPLSANESLQDHLNIITGDLDRETRSFAKWVDEGIFVGYVEKTTIRIAKISESGEIEILDFKGKHPMLNYDISKNGYITIIGASEKTIPEVFVSTKPVSSPDWGLQQLTNYGEKTEAWDLGTIETVKWKSRDGTEIEGILRKPLDFNPAKKYPLLFRLRGGPSSYCSALLLETMDRNYYPSIQFVHKDILVLKVNHRGSYGYGQAFLDLQKNNLGIGELWDLEGAIEHLDSLGFIDNERVGCMGWSYGGYVSAFAGIHSDKFRAVSVGAGSSNNYNYYVTRSDPKVMAQYLSGSPFINSENYVKTAPITGIKQARTPTLLQHGARDQAANLYNAMELYRGLKDMNVPVTLFIYPEMAHSITRPREMRTAMLQNLAWFSHHLLGEKLSFPGTN